MCAETSFVISNIVTSPLPPNIAFSLSSARIFTLVRGILKIVLLNVYPKLFDHLRSRERTLAHDRLQFWRKVERFR